MYAIQTESCISPYLLRPEVFAFERIRKWLYNHLSKYSGQRFIMKKNKEKKILAGFESSSFNHARVENIFGCANPKPEKLVTRLAAFVSLAYLEEKATVYIARDFGLEKANVLVKVTHQTALRNNNVGRWKNVLPKSCVCKRVSQKRQSMQAKSFLINSY